MTELAVVMLAHADPPKVRRLIEALPDVPVELHCDARSPDAVAAAMTDGLATRVHAVPRRRVEIFSWSMVEAELAGLRAAVARSSARHIAVMSGADHPLCSLDAVLDELAAWDGRSYFWNTPLPFAQWDDPRHPDGGLWRLRRRFLTRRDHVLQVKRVPLRWPLPRALPPGLRPRACSHWKVLSRRHAVRLLDVVDTRPDLVRFWRSTFIPAESFAASVLASPAIVGADDAMPTCSVHPWFMDWSGLGAHPEWLGPGHFDRLRDAALAPSPHPDDVLGSATVDDLSRRKLFARKMSTTHSSALMDRVDGELHRLRARPDGAA